VPWNPDWLAGNWYGGDWFGPATGGGDPGAMSAALAGSSAVSASASGMGTLSSAIPGTSAVAAYGTIYFTPVVPTSTYGGGGGWGGGWVKPSQAPGRPRTRGRKAKDDEEVLLLLALAGD
jgi:hypothetical protein